MKNHLIWLLFLVLGGFTLSCNKNRIPPAKPYSSYQLAPKPDYAQMRSWSALPQKQDFADDTPPGVAKEAQDSAKADVFFIHPTTFMGGLAWNADVRDRELNAKTDERAIHHQASIFNGSAKVYAPRYRQMSFGGFFTTDTLSKIRALELAYQDVRAAFQYYLEHFNHGRPIIIASHSQGSIHGIRLLREFFDGTDLQQQLVAAYLLGWPFPADTFQYIPVCQSPEETSCVMGWCTYKKGYIPESIDDYYKNAVVVNPLNWTANGTPASASEHLGFLQGNYKKMRTHVLNTEAYKGILWSSNPFPIIGATVKNYHAGDFNLFWLDVRENVNLRIEAYLAGR